MDSNFSIDKAVLLGPGDYAIAQARSDVSYLAAGGIASSFSVMLYEHSSSTAGMIYFSHYKTIFEDTFNFLLQPIYENIPDSSNVQFSLYTIGSNESSYPLTLESPVIKDFSLTLESLGGLKHVYSFPVSQSWILSADSGRVARHSDQYWFPTLPRNFSNMLGDTWSAGIRRSLTSSVLNCRYNSLSKKNDGRMSNFDEE